MIDKKTFENFVDNTCVEYGCETLIIYFEPTMFASLTNDFSDTDFKPMVDQQTAETFHLDFQTWKYITAKNNTALCIKYKKLRYDETGMFVVPAFNVRYRFNDSEYINTQESTDLPRKVDTGLMKPV